MIRKKETVARCSSRFLLHGRRQCADRVLVFPWKRCLLICVGTMRRGLVLWLCVGLTSCWCYSISPCDDNNKVQFEESDDAVLTCTGITHDDMVWRLSTDSTVSLIGTCSWPNGTCNVTDSDYSLSRRESARSVLTVTDNPRTKIAGTVQCVGLNPEGNVEGIVKCNVRVVYTSYQPPNCTATVITYTPYWKVSGSCDVNKIYASDDVYSCRWFETPQFGSGSRSFPGVMDLIASFNEEGRSYHIARCYFSYQPMPASNSNYIYSVKIDPSNSAYTTPILQIQSPAGPPVLFNCPDSMIEGDDYNCTCQASAAEPSALVIWSGSGPFAVSSETTLFLNSVPKSVDGHNYTCSQYWGGHISGDLRTTGYTLHVKYPPPLPPLISGNTTRMEGDSLVLNCAVTGGNPPVDYVTFYCGDKHGDSVDSTSTENGQTVVTSTIEIDSLTDRNNGSQCMCSTQWEPRPTLYQATSTVTILVLGLPGQSSPSPSEPATTVSGATNTTGKPSTSSEDDGDADLKLAVVGGIAAIIIIALIIVIICLWKRIREPRYARPATGRLDDDHNYTELDHYQQIGPQEQRTERKEEGTMDQDRDENSDVNPLESSSKAQYENTGFSEEPALSDGHYENTPEGGRPAPSEEDYEIPRRAVRQP